MPQITKIELKKDNTNVKIFLDNEFFCTLQNFVCLKHKLKENMEISEEQLQKIVLDSEKENALNKCANYLKHGVKSEKQIIKYLMGR